MPESIREQVLSTMQATFLAVTPSDTAHGTVWKRVLDSPYEGRDHKAQNVMSVIEGTETYIDVVSPDKRDRSLDIDIQTLCYIPLGVSLRTGANRVLSDLEQVIEANNLWNQLAYSTTLLANEVNREDTGDRTVELSLFINVRYRTKRTDPTART